MSGRGQLTDDIQDIAKNELGKELTTKELRLMPYINHCALNRIKLNPNAIDSEERPIISEWRSKGWIDGGASEVVVTSRKFWMVMHKILYLAYVDYDGACELNN